MTKAQAEQQARAWLITNKIFDADTGAPFLRDVHSLASLLLTAHAAGLDMGADILNQEVADHRKHYGEHPYCEDYSCHDIKVIEAKIREQAQQRRTG